MAHERPLQLNNLEMWGATGGLTSRSVCAGLRRNTSGLRFSIAKGTVDTVRPDIRTIVAHALRTNASAVIAGYNHSSGAAEPSDSDKLLTRDLTTCLSRETNTTALRIPGC